MAGVGSAVSTDPVTAAPSDPPVELVTVSATHKWEAVGIDGSFEDPVVVAGPVSYNGNHYSHARLRDVTAGEFVIRVEEWAYMDRLHLEEDIACLVADPGAHTLGDGTDLVAGRVTSDHERTSVSFPASFSTTPVVFSDTQTDNHSRPVVIRQRDVSKSGFTVRLQGSERRPTHGRETVGYLAVEPGTGTLNGRPFEAGIESGIDHRWSTIEFGGRYSEPSFLADMQTLDGPDSSNLRYRNLTGSSVEVRVEEAQSKDEETVHSDERVSYLVIGDDKEEVSILSEPTETSEPVDASDPAGFGVDEYGVEGFGA